MKAITWEGCYDKSLKGFITSDSFSHPAKMALGLCERIIDHCLERGWIRRGEVVGDPFNGVCTVGLVASYRGLRYVGVELEMKFVGLSRANINLHRGRLEQLGFPVPEVIEGDSRQFHKWVYSQLVLSSPPYADSYRGQKSGIDQSKVKRPGGPMGQSMNDTDYGSTSGQIGRLKSGDVEAVVTSPPFTQGYAGGGGVNKNGYTARPDIGPGWVGKRSYQGTAAEREDGNIGSLKQGDVQAVISSPPYAVISAGAGGLNTKPAKHAGQQSGRSATAASQDTDQRYGKTEGQIAALKGGSIDSVVTSPPYEEGLGHGGGERNLPHDSKGTGQAMSDGYPNSNGQIGQEKGETYWQAMNAVYRSCFEAIKPGGVICIVVKDYVKDKKRVPLCDDTLRLLQHVGFEPIERIHAMLVKETKHADMFVGETTSKTSRKSFFRRLAEAKGSPEINYEEVLICQKPMILPA